jgi:hypothetical protein
LILKLTSKFDLEIQEPISVWHTRRFAGVLKKATAMIIGCELSDLEKDSFKNTPLGEEWRRWFVIDKNLIGESLGESNGRVTPYFSNPEDALKYVKEKGWYWLDQVEPTSEILTPRLVLQLLGTEGGRDVIHPNIWVNATLGNLKEDDQVIITDVRFPNEVEGIKNRKGIVIRVVRPSKVSTSTHPSETSLNDYKNWDYVIVNDGTLEELEEKVIKMLEYFEIEHYTQFTPR